MRFRQSVSFLLVGVFGLAIGLNIGLFIGPPRQVTVQIPTTKAAPTPQNSMVDVSAPMWEGLQQASASFLQTVFHTPVLNAQGTSVPVPTDKPILFSAPFCPYCAEIEHLFIAHNMLSRLTMIGVALNGGEPSEGIPARTVTNAAQAQEAFKLDWAHYGIHYPTSGILYAMPGTPIDQAVQSYPTFLIPHDGKWYVEVGYNPSVTFWKAVLGA
ncbi:MAG: hypothetical protein K6T76_09175 [Alicyclobacillus mali]|nr:hypothetical protein [Alicyclobacillus mali (ex Roth et al. 2021)]